MKCTVENCTTEARAKGLCNRHYKEARKPAPVRPCECGCGELALRRFVSGHNTRLMPSEEQTRRGQMNTGEALRGSGSGSGYVKFHQRHQHRVVAEQKLGRPLQPGEIVHHENRKKGDNAPGNLEVMTQSEHARIHIRELQAQGKMNGCPKNLHA